MEFPVLPFERIIKKAGARRVSFEAAKELAKVMEDRITDIAEEAAALAKHAGRKTVIADDVRLARRKFE
ncbi:MAG: histone [Candidatus Aenigmatarchaeota archaeon]